MRAYDLEAVAREMYERRCRREHRNSNWEDVPGYIQGAYRADVREAIECYERNVKKLEEDAKREAKKKGKK